MEKMNKQVKLYSLLFIVLMIGVFSTLGVLLSPVWAIILILAVAGISYTSYMLGIVGLALLAQVMEAKKK